MGTFSGSRRSAGRPEFAGEPAHGIRFEGVRRNNRYLDLVAFRTFEQPVFEADWPRGNAFKQHPRLAARTARALNNGQELLA